MFVVDENTGRITLHRGDTGKVGITAATEYTFGADDVALFTVKSPDGTIIKSEIHMLDDKRFEVAFTNGETDYLSPGTYEWDVRYIANPVYDEDGSVVDGDIVATPRDPMAMNVLRTVGQI